ncbi:uncharacterized protein RBU33_002406 isoform 1-T1 [Hipposideros larvatus]
MAAGGEPPTQHRPCPIGVSPKPASTQRRAALTALALRGARGSLGGSGLRRTAHLPNGPAPWAARGGAALVQEWSGPALRRLSRVPPSSLLSAPPRFPALTFPPTRLAAFRGQAGMEPSRSGRASLPLSPPSLVSRISQTKGKRTRKKNHLDSVMSSDDCNMAIKADSLEEEAHEPQVLKVWEASEETRMGCTWISLYQSHPLEERERKKGLLTSPFNSPPRA